jgi:hypothetical protein
MIVVDLMLLLPRAKNLGINDMGVKLQCPEILAKFYDLIM